MILTQRSYLAWVRVRPGLARVRCVCVKYVTHACSPMGSNANEVWYVEADTGRLAAANGLARVKRRDKRAGTTIAFPLNILQPMGRCCVSGLAVWTSSPATQRGKIIRASIYVTSCAWAHTCADPHVVETLQYMVLMAFPRVPYIKTSTVGGITLLDCCL